MDKNKIKCPECGWLINKLSGTCPKCGAKNLPSPVICKNCGKVIPFEILNTNKEKMKKSLKCPNCGYSVH
jgi:DNA-directed RNA polymerase subunit RPC12/RpoP